MAINLAELSKKKTSRPPRILLYGPPGIGKSTFGAQAPNPIFLDVEGGLEEIECVKFPQDRMVANYAEALDFLGALYTQEHKHETLVVDSADWLEKLIHKKVAVDNGKTTVDDIAYGAGYAYALDQWVNFLAGLTALRNDRGMAIIMIAHVDVKKHNNPMGDNYDCFVPKLHGQTTKGDSALGVLTEWADAVLFAHYKVYTKSEQAGFDKNRKTHKAVTSEAVLGTSSENPAFRGKNRYNLPAEIPGENGKLSWNKFQEALIGAKQTTTPTT